MDDVYTLLSESKKYWLANKLKLDLEKQLVRIRFAGLLVSVNLETVQEYGLCFDLDLLSDK
jgi:hypothetical protein